MVVDSKRLRLPVIAAGTLLFLVTLSATSAGAACDGAPYNELDFAIGEWVVSTNEGQILGRSVIEKVDEGCVLKLDWRPTEGPSTRALTFYDPAYGGWREVEVDSNGGSVRSFGKFDGKVLSLRGETVRADGTTGHQLLELSPRPDGRLDLRIEVSPDGESWSVEFDGTYASPTARRETKQPEASPTPSPTETAAAPVDASPAPSREAPQRGAVRARSERVAKPSEVERIDMESPMILTVPIGPIESVPEGYGWGTRETSPFISEGATIQRIQLERKERRGKVELHVEIQAHGRKYTQKSAVQVDVMAGEEVLASGVIASFRMGDAIPDQIEFGYVPRRMTLEIDRATFDRAFKQSDERPILQITVTAQ